jgi:hypothetical protein
LICEHDHDQLGFVRHGLEPEADRVLLATLWFRVSNHPDIFARNGGFNLLVKIACHHTDLIQASQSEGLNLTQNKWRMIEPDQALWYLTHAQSFPGRQDKHCDSFLIQIRPVLMRHNCVKRIVQCVVLHMQHASRLAQQRGLILAIADPLIPEIKVDSPVIFSMTSMSRPGAGWRKYFDSARD